MDIKELYGIITDNISPEKTLLITDSQLGFSGGCIGDFLKSTFVVDAISLTGVQCVILNGAVLLRGTAQLEGQPVELALRLSDGGNTGFFLEMCVNYSSPIVFDCFSARTFSAEKAQKRYSFPIREGAKYSFMVTGIVNEEIGYDTLILMVLEGLSCNAITALPSLSNFRMTYDRENQRDYWKITVGVQSDAMLQLTEKIKIGRLGMIIIRSDQAFDLTLSGEIRLVGKPIPVKLACYGDSFLFGIHPPRGGSELPSLADIAELVGVHLADVLPDYFSGVKNIRLTKLLFYMPSNLSGLSSAEIGIASPGKWEFLGISGLSLNDISLSIELDYAAPELSYVVVISGVLGIGSVLVELAARKASGGFLFSGMLPLKAEYNFKTLIGDFSNMLGVGSLELPIPVIILEYASISFDTSEASGRRFEAAAFVRVQLDEDEEPDIVKKLLNISAKIHVVSDATSGTRKLSGKFNGVLDIKDQEISVEYTFGAKSDKIYLSWESKGVALTIASVMEAFGAKELPEELTSLDISIDSLAFTCHIKQKMLTGDIVCKKYGSLHIELWQDSATPTAMQFMVAVACTKKIELSELPLVGKDLHLLDKTSIDRLSIRAASTATEPAIKAGVALLGEITAGDVKNPFLLELSGAALSEETNADSKGISKWFTIEKSLGIFVFHRIAISYRQGYAGFLLDASLSANPIRIDLLEVGAGVSLSDPKSVRFYLSGLSIAYQNPTMELSGSFYENDGSYDGALVLKTPKLNLFAIGSYQEQSIFAFALLNIPIGGPPAFFITGLAAGFGYNRELSIPPIEAVSRFPLVLGAFGSLDYAQMLQALKQYVSPSKGQSFVAAGVKFTSFKMVDSFALVNVTFGSRLSLAVLGLSAISVPAHIDSTPIAFAQLALRVVCTPDDGVFALMAELTSESYILSKACKLTGGFAFYLWFGREHRGDFVITLGGYHPSYKKPAHYPDVPRLGFCWRVTSNLTFSGNLYFALTPCGIMAGGGISAVFQSGELRAWFRAQADFWINWKPYHYEASLYIGLGASYRLNLLFCHVTLSVELSADLKIWGPDFSVRARITWFIISFTIESIKSENKKQYINWESFEKSFLPQRKLPATDAEVTVTNSLNIEGGLLAENENREPIVDSEKLRLTVKTAVPATLIQHNSRAVETAPIALGVLPTGEGKTLKALFHVTIIGPDKREKNFCCRVIEENVPVSLWGLSETGMDGERVVGAWTGLTLWPELIDACPTLPPDKFLDIGSLVITMEKKFSWTQPKPLSGPAYPQDHTVRSLAETLADTKVAANRKALVRCFEKLHQFDEPDELSRLARFAPDLIVEDVRLQTMV